MVHNGIIETSAEQEPKARTVADHPKKHIREAIRYAEEHGWSVMSTPRNPEAHARDIRRDVDRCPH